MLGAALMMAGASAPSTLLNGLVEHWKLDGNGNGSLGAHNATATGSVTYTTGKINQGLQRLGASYLEAPTTAQLGSWSVGLWLYPTGASASNVFGFGVATNNNMVDLIWHISGNAVGVHWNGNSATEVLSPLTPSAWSLYVLTYNGSALTPYVNAVAGASYSKTLAIAAGPLRIGGGIYGAFNTGDFGVIDEVLLANRAWTQAEITELYNGGAGKAYPF